MTKNEDRQLRHQADSYFRSRSQGYDRLFKGLLRKYRSLGHFGGKLTLPRLSLEEADVLTGLLNKRFDPGSDGIIRVSDVESGFAKTKYAQLDLLSILEGYFGEPIVSKKEEQLLQEREWDLFWADLLETVAEEPCSKAQGWIQALAKHQGTGALAVSQWWSASAEELREALLTVVRAVRHLDRMADGEYIRLAVLATQVTGNPHGFDMQTQLGKLLLYAICYILEKVGPANAEEMTQILYECQILRDDLSSQVAISGIVGQNTRGRGYLGSEKEVYGLPLRTVVKYAGFEPYLMEGGVKRVWIVENPAVFSSILDRWEHDYPEEALPPLVCSSGQFSLAVLALCDRLAAAGCQMFYSGDYDPEGFQMAIRLWRRYGDEHVAFWRYQEEDYTSKVQEIPIEERRWNQLRKLVEDEGSRDLPADLVKTMQTALRELKPVYQEALLDKLYLDIKTALVTRIVERA